jgi:hypothetical protein
VISSNPSFRHKREAVAIKQVGRELGVRFVLEGSVGRAKGRLRVDPLLGRQARVALPDAYLGVGRALDGVDHACELDEGTVAGQLDDSAPMLGDFGCDEFLAQSLQSGGRAGLVPRP